MFRKAEKVLSYLDKEGKEIMLIGDTNCDLSEDTTCLSSASNARYIVIFMSYSVLNR